MFKVVRAMKYLFICPLFLSACTSTQQLKEQPVCSVWKDQGALGPLYAQINENKVQVKTKCYFYFWLCSSIKGRIENDGKIYVEGSNVFQGEQHIASLKDKTVTYESSIADKLVKSSPIEIDTEKRKVTKSMELTFLSRTKNEVELEFSPACKVPEVALGAVTVWMLENSQ